MKTRELQVGDELFLRPDVCVVLHRVDEDGVLLMIKEQGEVRRECLLGTRPLRPGHFCGWPVPGFSSDSRGGLHRQPSCRPPDLEAVSTS